MKYVDLENGMRIAVVGNNVLVYILVTDGFGNKYYSRTAKVPLEPKRDAILDIDGLYKTENYLASVIAAMAETISDFQRTSYISKSPIEVVKQPEQGA